MPMLWYHARTRDANRVYHFCAVYAIITIAMDRLPLDVARLIRDLEALAGFTEPGFEGWTRRAFSPAFIEGRAWLAAQMRDAGLAVAVDAAGNLIGRRAGAIDRPALVIGSHTDTVPGAGRFDGMLGVL